MQKLKHQRFILTIALMLSLTMHLIYGIEGAAQLGAMEQKLQRQAAQLKDKQEQIEVLERLYWSDEIPTIPTSLNT